MSSFNSDTSFEYSALSKATLLENGILSVDDGSDDSNCATFYDSEEPNKEQIKPSSNLLSNAGIYLSYGTIGSLTFLLEIPVSFYLIQSLKVDPSRYGAFTTLISIPGLLKCFLGILSDCFPLGGYHRKSWLCLAWLSFACIAFAVFAASPSPSFTIITLVMLLLTLAYYLADVCSDALCVERAQREQLADKGRFQTRANLIRSVGGILGAIFAAIAYQGGGDTAVYSLDWSINQLFLCVAVLPIVQVLPSLFWLQEDKADNRDSKKKSIKQSLSSMWQTLQLRAVWSPLGFLFVFFALQIPNAAWNNFLITGLQFDNLSFGLMSTIWAIAFWLGMVTFDRCFFQANWRSIFLSASCIIFLLCLLEMAFILRWTARWGLNDLLVVIIDGGLISFVRAILFMPVCIMFSSLCPQGEEGGSYALLTTILNLAGAVAADLGTLLTFAVDVKNDTLLRGDYSGVFQIAWMTSGIQLVPLLFLWILPANKEELQQLLAADDQEDEDRQHRQHRSSRLGGSILLLVIAVSMTATLSINIALI